MCKLLTPLMASGGTLLILLAMKSTMAVVAMRSVIDNVVGFTFVRMKSSLANDGISPTGTLLELRCWQNSASTSAKFLITPQVYQNTYKHHTKHLGNPLSYGTRQEPS